MLTGLPEQNVRKWVTPGRAMRSSTGQLCLLIRGMRPVHAALDARCPKCPRSSAPVAARETKNSRFFETMGLVRWWHARLVRVVDIFVD